MISLGECKCLESWSVGTEAVGNKQMNFSLLVFVASQVGAVLKEAQYTAAVC